MTKEVLYINTQSGLASRGNQIKWIVIGEEKHGDGGRHFHVALQTMKRVRTGNPLYFDFMADKHGDYQKMKGSVRDAVKYVTKGGDYFEWGMNVKACLEHRGAQTSTKIMGMIAKGKALGELLEEYSGFMLSNKRKAEEWIAWHSDNKRRCRVIDWPGLKSCALWPDGMCDCEELIMKWVEDNLFKPRVFKQKQLFVWGPANVGKTHLCNELAKYCRTYLMPHEDFYDLYEDGKYDLVILDEFKATKTVQFLNEFLQGSAMSLRKKGTQAEKNDNLPVIVLSNYSLEECYCNVDNAKLDTLKCRFLEVYVEKRMTFNFDVLLKEARNEVRAYHYKCVCF